MSRAHREVARTGRRPLIIGLTGLAVALVGLAVSPAPAAPVLSRQVGNPCADVVDEVRISGSSSSHIAVSSWGAGMCAEADVIADAINTGSKGGRDAIIAGTASIGLTSLPFTEEEEAALVAAERGVVMVPVLAGAAVCTYWDRSAISDYPQGKGYPNLRVSRETMGRMLAGRTYETLGDGPPSSPGDDLSEDNAGNEDYPREGRNNLNTEFYARSGFSAMTYEVGRWVAADAEAEAGFEDHLDASSNYDADLPFEEMPSPQSGQPRIVNDYAVMAKQMVEATTALGIGCMDGATARTDARPENPGEELLNLALLEASAGVFVAPTDTAVTAGVETMVPNGDGTFRPAPSPVANDPDAADPPAYPMPLVVYAAVPTCGFDETSKAATARVLDYMVGAGQEDLPAGNVALVGEVAAASARQLASWKASAVARPCGEDAPPPTTTSTTTTIVPGGPTTTLPPFVDPGTTPSIEGGVQPDPGFTDPAGGGGSSSTGGGGGTTDPGADLPAAEDTAAAAPTGPIAESAAPEELDPVARIVAMAQGSAALPPIALVIGGVVLLVVGPVLQTADGMSRSSSLPSHVRRWFSRLRP